MGCSWSCCKNPATTTPLHHHYAQRGGDAADDGNRGGKPSVPHVLSGSATMTTMGFPSTFSSSTINGGPPNYLNLNHNHHSTDYHHHQQQQHDYDLHQLYVMSPEGIVASRGGDDTWGMSSMYLDDEGGGGGGSQSHLPHISEREFKPDAHIDPSLNPVMGPLFKRRREPSRNFLESSSTTASASERYRRRRSYMSLLDRPMKKSSSCSTIYIDESTVSKPDLKTTLKGVALAVYNLLKNRTSNRVIDIFDERLHPLTKENVYSSHQLLREPDQRSIYRFIRNLFNASQLTSECAIVTLVYLERLLTNSELDLCPATWKRALLGSIMLASKVWDDQAVWNVDYCQILKDVSVESMNELERTFLERIQFNINVQSSVYAKYYFDLRGLADENDLVPPPTRLTLVAAERLEALSRNERAIYTDLMSNKTPKGGTPKGIPNSSSSLHGGGGGGTAPDVPSTSSASSHAPHQSHAACSNSVAAAHLIHPVHSLRARQHYRRRWNSLEGGLESVAMRSLAVLS